MRDNIILYLFYDEKENKAIDYRNNNTSIMIRQGDQRYLESLTCGCRTTSIFADKEFLNPKYELWLNESIKPTLCLHNSDKYITFI